MNIPAKFKVEPFLVFYLVHASQVGVGILGFQRILMEEAGHDAWISILITGFIYHIILYMIFNMLNTYKTDLTGLHKKFFGKWVGKCLDFVFIIYVLVTAFTVIRTYIEVVQVWMFPQLASWVLGVLFCTLIYYVVTGGFRVVTGICFFGVVIPSFLTEFFFFPLQYADFGNLLPILDTPFPKILSAVNDTALSYLGLEMLLVYYPFIRKPEKSQKFAHLGLAATTSLYVFITLVTFAFYSEKQLEKTVWATLSLFKVAEFSFLERFEYFAVAIWVFVVIPNMVIYLWVSTRVAKESFHLSQRKILAVFLTVIFISIVSIDSRVLVDQINTYLGNLAFYFIIGYIPALYLISKLHNRMHRRSKT
ncbi:GerAB/ArcD/ProY family transporter [Bacillus tianshenii]|nr:GerAB/ArcD/ProY family transporter [Bacillus tianshenii]